MRTGVDHGHHLPIRHHGLRCTHLLDRLAAARPVPRRETHRRRHDRTSPTARRLPARSPGTFWFLYRTGPEFYLLGRGFFFLTFKLIFSMILLDVPVLSLEFSLVKYSILVVLFPSFAKLLSVWTECVASNFWEFGRTAVAGVFATAAALPVQPVHVQQRRLRADLFPGHQRHGRVSLRRRPQARQRQPHVRLAQPHLRGLQVLLRQRSARFQCTKT